MTIHRSLKTMCVSALFGLAVSSCSAADSEEDVATVEQDLTAVSVGPVPGWTSTETVLASRGLGQLDIFRIVSSNVSYSRYTHATGHDLTDLGNPGVNLVSLAVAVNDGRLELFATTTTGAVYHKTGTGTGVPTWSIWNPLSGVTAKQPSEDSITVTSWGPGRMDLFWVTPAGNLGHKWADGNVWQGTETGDNGGPFYLRSANGSVLSPPIESISTRANRIDIVVGGPGPLSHHTWDGTASGWAVPQAMACCSTGETVHYSLYDFALMHSSSHNFEMFGLRRFGGDTIVPRFVHTTLGGWSKNSLGRIKSADTTMTGPDTAAIGDPDQEVRINQGLRWDGTRRDIVGWMDTNIGNLMWQMFIP